MTLNAIIENGPFKVIDVDGLIEEYRSNFWVLGLLHSRGFPLDVLSG
jgi:hypothetical protein